MNLDDKWLLVKEFYEKAYKVRFRHRVTDAKIEFLYNEMIKLSDSIRNYKERARPLIRTIIDPYDRELE